MPADDSPAYLVARFLKSNNYEKTLDAFIAEASLPPDAGSLPNKHALTLESVLEEKRAFDISRTYTKTSDSETSSAWVTPAPSVPQVVRSLPSSANFLSVSVPDLHFSPIGADNGGEPAKRPFLLASAADRNVSMLDARSATLDLVAGLPSSSGAGTRDSPVLWCETLDADRVVTTAMSGAVSLVNVRTGTEDTRRDHRKYVVRATAALTRHGTTTTTTTRWLATAGWDARVLLYKVTGDEIGAPLADITLPTNPETIIFTRDQDDERLFLLVSRRDSSSIYYYLVNEEASGPEQEILVAAGSQNLAPHSNAWVAFSPSSMAVSPTDRSLLAVATSSLPHMKAIVVRLLFPVADDIGAAPPVYDTQTGQARASLARQDREEAAILVHVNTMAPQTPYSTPQVCWRPNGSGIYVNGDDGVVRGIEAKTGKIVEVLKDGHEPGSKIRSLWAGYVGEDRQEWLVTGGFDRRLIVWRMP